jgi:hypothetical protein
VADHGVSFALDLDQSGTSRLTNLELGADSLAPTVLFRGEDATLKSWPAVFGLSLTAIGTPKIGLLAPFTDGTRAVELGAAGEGYVAESADTAAVGSDDFALEFVLRAAPRVTLADQRGSGIGWAVRTTVDGALSLELQDANQLFTITSQPLSSGAWYDCLFWVSRALGGAVYCDGRAGSPSDLSALGDLTSAAPLALGGSSGENAELAYFALFRARATTLGTDSAAWEGLSRMRFAELTGASPRVALGSALPENGVRASSAYLDLQAGEERDLFLVGEDWPRIACRADNAAGTRCGYLSEPARTRFLPANASEWTANELAVNADRALFADGAASMAALVPSSANTEHALSFSGTFAGARQALSLFARAESGQFIALGAGAGAAIFDLHAGVVVAAPPSARATLENWGNGLFRCSYVFAPDPGALSYRVALLAGPSTSSFAGDGSSSWIDVAGLQLDVGAANAGSLLAADEQAADQLSFVGNDGNLPSSEAVSESLGVLLPAGPRLNDEAVLSLNLAGEFGNQVELYVTGDTGELKFWALRDGDTHWAFNHPASFVDGVWHDVGASWNATSAALTVDGVPATQTALTMNLPVFSLDHIDVGFSSSSSGNLEGLIGGIEIRAGTP